MKTLLTLMLTFCTFITLLAFPYEIDSKIVVITSKGKHLTEGHCEKMINIVESLIARKLTDKEMASITKEFKKEFIKNPENTLSLLENTWSRYIVEQEINTLLFRESLLNDITTNYDFITKISGKACLHCITVVRP